MLGFDSSLCSLQAYDVCTKRGLTRERVFILGRMGNSREALALIINELKDIQQVWSLFDRFLQTCTCTCLREYPEWFLHVYITLLLE